MLTKQYKELLNHDHKFSSRSSLNVLLCFSFLLKGILLISGMAEKNEVGD